MTTIIDQSIKLIAFDQDDTALLPDGSASPEGICAIEAALNKGIIVSSVSGRNIDRSSETFRHVQKLLDRLYIIANNGSIILGPAEHGRRDLLFEQRIPADTFQELLDYVEAREFNFVYSWLRMTGEGARDSVISNRHTASIDAINTQGATQVAIDQNLIGQLRMQAYPSPPKMLILPGLAQREQVLEGLKATFGDRLYLVKTNPDRIEIMHPEVNKKTGIEFISRRHGFSLDHVMAIGDGENDLPMLFGAGLGVIMGNAEEKVREKGEAHGLVIAPPNHEHGFAWAVRRYALGERV
ncbi:MAG TPA: HAD-IIB family hydrolase [candidate division Zixibacteria bacterium]|nr:HAD-IIB family hydrolase [candidate division Zixibacteria bacterium]